MNPLIPILRLFLALGSFAVVASKQIGEKVIDFLSKRPSKSASSAAAAAPLAQGGILASSITFVSLSPPSVDTSVSTSTSASNREIPPSNDGSAGSSAELEFDELDWAGSLPHAAVSSLHLEQVVAMVRAGWLIPSREHATEVSKTLHIMAKFQDRTAVAIAPLLSTLSEEQSAEFFDDFMDVLPLELPQLEAPNDTVPPQ